MIENTNLNNDMAHPFSRRHMIMPPATVEDAAQAEGKHVGPDAAVSTVTCKSFKGIAINYDIDDCLGTNYSDFDGITAETEYVDDYGVTWYDVTNRSAVVPSSVKYIPILVWDNENFAFSSTQVPLDHAIKQSAYVQLTGSVYDSTNDNLTINSYMLFNKAESDPFDIYVINGYRFQIFGSTAKAYVKVLKVNPEDHSEILDEVASVQILDGSQSHTMIGDAGAAIKLSVTSGAGCYLVTIVTEDANSSSLYIGGLVVSQQDNSADIEVTLSSGTKTDHEVEIQ